MNLSSFKLEASLFSISIFQQESGVDNLGKHMKTTIKVKITYDEFIAGHELSEIISVIDEALWYELTGKSPVNLYPHPQYRRKCARCVQPRLPLCCISEINEGSIIITLSGLFTGVAAKYCYDRFKKGFRRSGFSKAMEKLGEGAGDGAAQLILRLNYWLLRYTKKAKKNGSRLKAVQVSEGVDHNNLTAAGTK